MSKTFALHMEQGLGVDTIKTTGIYGAYWDGSSNSTLLRTDDAALFADPSPAVNNGNGSSPFDKIMPWAGMERVEDSEVGTLVSIPKFYYKWTRDSEVTGDMKLQISPEQQTGFYVSPAHADRGDGKGERDVVYVGAYHCATNTYKSTSGVLPQGSITRATARTNIHNLGSTIWQLDYAMVWTIRMLYLIEYADWDSQKIIGYGCGNDSSIENTGASDNMVYHTGTAQSSKTIYGVGIRYRYIEDFWCNVFDWCDGIYFAGTNNLDIYCIKNPASFSDNSNGTKVGTRTAATGCIKKLTNSLVNGFEYAFYPLETISREIAGYEYEVYICDDCNYATTGTMLVIGGFYGHSHYYGMFFGGGNDTASTTVSFVGCRLMKLP